jgi:hypothetical protein
MAAVVSYGRGIVLTAGPDILPMISENEVRRA